MIPISAHEKIVYRSFYFGSMGRWDITRNINYNLTAAAGGRPAAVRKFFKYGIEHSPTGAQAKSRARQALATLRYDVSVFSRVGDRT